MTVHVTQLKTAETISQPKVESLHRRRFLKSKKHKNLSSSSVVVQVHQSAVVFVDLPSVDEDPRKVQTILDVRAAPAPLPAVRRKLPFQLSVGNYKN